MSHKLTVTMGGEASAPIVDYTPVVQVFDAGEGPAGLIEMGMSFADGSASEGTFNVDDDAGEIPRSDDTRNLAAKNVVLWTEDASGAEIWLSRGRIANKDVGRNEDYPIADARQFSVQTNDANVDLKQLNLREPWVRPAESDYDRLVALQAYTLNGASSTAPAWRRTTVITVDSAHLAPNTNTVVMPAKTYEVGTSIDEIVADCADTAGKTWGVEIHHDGGSHLCLEYILADDHTTYLSPVKVSDVLSEIDTDSLTAPVVLPIWDQGAATVESGQEDPISALILKYGSGDKFVIAEDTSKIAGYDYAVDVYNDDLSVTVGQATARANAILDFRSREHLTHQVTIILKDTQVHLIGAGMSLRVKAAAMMGGQYLHTEQTRRIAQCKFEPRSPRTAGVPGTYFVHLQLDRIFRSPFGRGTKPTVQPAQDCDGSPEFVDDWGGTTSLVSGMTVPDDPTQILLLFYVSGSAGDLGAVSYDPDSTTVLDPQPQSLSKLTEMTAPNGETLQVWYLLAPTASVGANGSISYGVVGTATKCHAVLLKNINQTTPLRASEQTTAPDGSGSISNAVASLASDFVVSFLGFTGQDGGLVDPVPGGSQTLIHSYPAWRGPGDSGAGMGLSYQVGASQTNSWTVHNASSNDNFGLGQLDLMFGGCAGAAVSIGGPGEGTVGTGGTYVPGGTVVEHGDLSGKGGIMHDDTQIEVDPTGLTNTDGVTVHGVIEDFDAAITAAASGGSYTDEDAQDAVGTILTDSSTVDFTYTDATPTITAAVIPSGIKLDDLGTPDDNTDLNASTSKHGLLRKLSGTSTEYLDGSGAWSTPPGGASLTIEEEDGTPSGTPSTLKVTNGTLTDNGDGSFSLDIPSPTGGTVNVEEEDGTPSVAADTIKFPNASVTDNGDGSVSVAFPAGGGSTGWTKLINADDMSTLTNWTVRSGTWTAGGTYGVNQTANDQDDFLECNENLSAYTLRAIQATVRLTNTGKVGMGFADSGGWGGGDLSIALDDGNDDVWWDRFGIGGSSVNFTVAQNTDYVLLLVEQSPGSSFKVYVDGVYQTLVTASSVNAGRVGLYCRNGAGWFRDVTVWGWSPGIPT